MRGLTLDQTGLEKFKVYPMAQVAPYLNDWNMNGCRNGVFPLPTEVVVNTPQIVVPDFGRMWETRVDGLRIETENGSHTEFIMAMEWYESTGSDGHTEYCFSGFVLYSSEDEEWLMKAPYRYGLYDNNYSELPRNLADAVANEVNKRREDKEDEEDKDGMATEGVTPEQNTIDGLLRIQSSLNSQLNKVYGELSTTRGELEEAQRLLDEEREYLFRRKEN